MFAIYIVADRVVGIRGRLIWKKRMEWNQGMISEGLGMKLDSFFNVFGREKKWNQIIILIICL